MSSSDHIRVGLAATVPDQQTGQHIQRSSGAPHQVINNVYYGLVGGVFQGNPTINAPLITQTTFTGPVTYVSPPPNTKPDTPVTKVKNDSLETYGFPDPPDYFHRKGVESEIRDKIKKLTAKRNKSGALMIWGEGGIGKTTLISQLFDEDPQFFYNECNIQVVLWLNCFRWNNGFKKEAFLEALSEIANAGDLPSLRSIFNHFGPNNKVLIVLDDVFNKDLVEYYVAECPKKVATVVLSRDRRQFEEWHETYNIAAISDWYKVPEVTETEIVDAFKTTYGLLQLDDEKLKKLASYCCGLMLIVEMLPPRFTFCSEEEDYEEKFDKLVTELESSRHKERKLATDERFAERTICGLFRFGIEKLSEGDKPHIRRMYYALLLSHPGEQIKVKDIAILWGLGDNDKQALEFCKMYESLSLLRRKVRKVGNLGTDKGVLIHQMLHEAALKDAIAQWNPTRLDEANLQFLRRDIVAGYCINGLAVMEHQWPTSVLLRSMLELNNRAFLEKVIHLVDGNHWPFLCKLNVKTTDGRVSSFARYLFDFTWADDVLNENNSGSFMTRHSSRLLWLILMKAKENSKESVKEITSSGDQHDNLVTAVFRNWDKWKNNTKYQLLCIEVDMYQFMYQRNNENNKLVINTNKIDNGQSSTAPSKGKEQGKKSMKALYSRFINTPGNMESAASATKQLVLAAATGDIELVQYLLEMFPTSVEMSRNDGVTPLWMSVHTGEMEIVKVLFEAFPKAVEMSNNDGVTPLLIAAYNGHLEIVKFLYEKFPKAVEMPNKDGDTPFWMAVINGHVEIMKFLFEKFPKAVEIPNNNGVMPLLIAAHNGHMEIVTFLYQKFPKAVEMPDIDGVTPLLTAAANGLMEVVEFLFEKFPKAVELPNNNGATPLWFAASNGHVAIVQFLLEKFPKAVEYPNNDGVTPLFIAAQNGHVKIVKLLFANCPRVVETESNKGETPLLVSAGNGHLEIVKILFEKFPKAVDMPNNDGVSPLFMAAGSGHLEIVKFLLESFPNVIEMPCNNGNSLLFVAAGNGHLEIVNFLCGKYPESVKLRNNHGNMALSAAAFVGNLEIVKLLYGSYPASVSHLDDDGDSALVDAVLQQHLDVVQFLYEKYPDSLPIANKSGLTVLDMAKAKGTTPEIIQFLESKLSISVATSTESDRNESLP